MCGTESRKELPLVSSASGCSCCSSETPPGGPVTTTGDTEYGLEGLTCGHCVETVRKAVTAVNGVETASIDLVSGGRSRLIISGSAPDTAIREAVTSAGYSLIPS